MGLGGGGFKIPFKRYSSVKFSSNKLTSTDWARTQFKLMLRFFGPELRNKYLSPTETSQFAMQCNAMQFITASKYGGKWQKNIILTLCLSSEMRVEKRKY